mmetsp:Transcript_18096/g.46675  ORF Transcript_18096/g.46675 Transcript_18096/m.46675 type:complete len:200 (-) Transcript_18096:285-884(-)
MVAVPGYHGLVYGSAHAHVWGPVARGRGGVRDAAKHVGVLLGVGRQEVDDAVRLRVRDLHAEVLGAALQLVGADVAVLVHVHALVDLLQVEGHTPLVEVRRDGDRLLVVDLHAEVGQVCLQLLAAHRMVVVSVRQVEGLAQVQAVQRVNGSAVHDLLVCLLVCRTGGAWHIQADRRVGLALAWLELPLGCDRLLVLVPA